MNNQVHHWPPQFVALVLPLSPRLANSYPSPRNGQDVIEGQRRCQHGAHIVRGIASRTEELEAEDVDRP